MFKKVSSVVIAVCVCKFAQPLIAECLGKAPSSPYMKYRYLVICKNPKCLNPRFGSNDIVMPGLANFLMGDWGVAGVVKAITFGKVNFKETCKNSINGSPCGHTDCQFVDTRTNPDWWK